MAPPLDFASALTQLKLLTSQTGNFTFTDDEMTQALQTAWQDSYVCTSVYDSSLSFVTGQYQYAIPTSMTIVTGIEFQRTFTDFPEPISRDIWEVIPGYIQFNVNAPIWLSDGYQMYVKGRYKLALTDSLSTDSLVNYVLTNAAYILLRNLVLKRAFVFLRNDTSMQDIRQARNDMRTDMLYYKQSLQREFEAI